jgi:hypothetical protein
MSKQICQLHRSKHHFVQKLSMNEHVFATRARDLSLSYFFSPLFVLDTLTEELRKYYRLATTATSTLDVCLLNQNARDQDSDNEDTRLRYLSVSKLLVYEALSY